MPLKAFENQSDEAVAQIVRRFLICLVAGGFGGGDGRAKAVIPLHPHIAVQRDSFAHVIGEFDFHHHLNAVLGNAVEAVERHRLQRVAFDGAGQEAVGPSVHHRQPAVPDEFFGDGARDGDVEVRLLHVVFKDGNADALDIFGEAAPLPREVVAATGGGKQDEEKGNEPLQEISPPQLEPCPAVQP